MVLSLGHGLRGTLVCWALPCSSNLARFLVLLLASFTATSSRRRPKEPSWYPVSSSSPEDWNLLRFREPQESAESYTPGSWLGQDYIDSMATTTSTTSTSTGVDVPERHSCSTCSCAITSTLKVAEGLSLPGLPPCVPGLHDGGLR